METKSRSRLPPAMVWCERGIQVLLTTTGAFAAFALMTVAIGTDYWLYARAFICNSTANSSQEETSSKDKKDPGALTHSGLWRICCLEGLKRGVCSQINSFSEDEAEYDQELATYPRTGGRTSDLPQDGGAGPQTYPRTGGRIQNYPRTGGRIQNYPKKNRYPGENELRVTHLNIEQTDT
ncbi:unnamed protein product [Boreogadus saida]